MDTMFNALLRFSKAFGGFSKAFGGLSKVF
jgi:hypothetical protein